MARPLTWRRVPTAMGGNSQCNKYVLAWSLAGALGEACRYSLLHVLALSLGVACDGLVCGCGKREGSLLVLCMS